MEIVGGKQITLRHILEVEKAALGDGFDSSEEERVNARMTVTFVL